MRPQQSVNKTKCAHNMCKYSQKKIKEKKTFSPMHEISSNANKMRL